MAKIIVYNNSTDRMETYYRGESQSMPYNYADDDLLITYSYTRYVLISENELVYNLIHSFSLCG